MVMTKVSEEGEEERILVLKLLSRTSKSGAPLIAMEL